MKMKRERQEYNNKEKEEGYWRKWRMKIKKRRKECDSERREEKEGEA